MRKFYSIRICSFFIALACIMLSCEKVSEPATTNGVIMGKVTDEQYFNLERVRVSSYGPYGKSTIETDNEGKFLFNGVGNGNYYIEFRRSDLGTRRIYNLKILDNEVIFLPVTLYHLPGDFNMVRFVKAYVAARPRSYPVEPWICIQTDARQENYEWNRYIFQFILFFSSEPDVNFEHYDVAFQQWEAFFWDDPVCLYCNPSALPFKKGQTVYVLAYACNPNENAAQIDPYTGKPEFSTLDRKRYTNVVSFSMP